MLLFPLLLLAALAGAVEAILYARRGAEAFLGNEHVLLRARDGAAIFGVVAALADRALWTSYPQLAALLGAWVLAFSFFHNNAYNFCRLWIGHEPRSSRAAPGVGTLRLAVPVADDHCPLRF
jgi:hypothetical protein